MSTLYRHTQHAPWMAGALIVLAVITAAMMWVTPAAAHGPLVAAVAVLVASALFVSSLTVEVDDAELRWHFGPGLWRYRIARADIVASAAVRNRWWYGFGIRLLPGFRLYNVSGLDAVEVRLQDGRVRRIGTDDPHGLAAALGGGIDRPAAA